MPIILGINPVVEALEAGTAIDKIYLLTGKQGAAFARIYRLARSRNIPIVQTPHARMEKMSGGKKSQGVIALSPPIQYVPLEDLVDTIQKSGENANLIMVDHLTDPQNFGAIIRSAEIFGAHGIIFSLQDAVPVTELVIKASAGAIFHINMCKVTNLASTLSYLRKCGVWIYASSSHSAKTIWEMEFTLPQVVVVGSEGKGIRRLLLEKSDEAFRIPQAGKTESLNVSVATGIILAEVYRQRQLPGQDAINE